MDLSRAVFQACEAEIYRVRNALNQLRSDTDAIMTQQCGDLWRTKFLLRTLGQELQDTKDRLANLTSNYRKRRDAAAVIINKQVNCINKQANSIMKLEVERDMQSQYVKIVENMHSEECSTASKYMWKKRDWKMRACRAEKKVKRLISLQTELNNSRLEADRLWSLVVYRDTSAVVFERGYHERGTALEEVKSQLASAMDNVKHLEDKLLGSQNSEEDLQRRLSNSEIIAKELKEQLTASRLGEKELRNNLGNARLSEQDLRRQLKDCKQHGCQLQSEMKTKERNFAFREQKLQQELKRRENKISWLRQNQDSLTRNLDDCRSNANKVLVPVIEAKIFSLKTKPATRSIGTQTDPEQWAMATTAAEGPGGGDPPSNPKPDPDAAAKPDAVHEGAPAPAAQDPKPSQTDASTQTPPQTEDKPDVEPVGEASQVGATDSTLPGLEEPKPDETVPAVTESGHAKEDARQEAPATEVPEVQDGKEPSSTDGERSDPAQSSMASPDNHAANGQVPATEVKKGKGPSNAGDNISTKGTPATEAQEVKNDKGPSSADGKRSTTAGAGNTDVPGPGAEDTFDGKPDVVMGEADPGTTSAPPVIPTTSRSSGGMDGGPERMDATKSQTVELPPSTEVEMGGDQSDQAQSHIFYAPRPPAFTQPQRPIVQPSKKWTGASSRGNRIGFGLAPSSSASSIQPTSTPRPANWLLNAKSDAEKGPASAPEQKGKARAEPVPTAQPQPQPSSSQQEDPVDEEEEKRIAAMRRILSQPVDPTTLPEGKRSLLSQYEIQRRRQEDLRAFNEFQAAARARAEEKKAAAAAAAAKRAEEKAKAAADRKAAMAAQTARLKAALEKERIRKTKDVKTSKGPDEEEDWVKESFNFQF